MSVLNPLYLVLLSVLENDRESEEIVLVDVDGDKLGAEFFFGN